MSPSFERWDIVVLPFPYSDAAREKKRPVLIISDTGFHQQFNACWAMMITSARHSSWPCDIPIRGEQTGLHVPCVLRPAKLATADTARILRKTGSLGAAERREVKRFLAQHFTFK